jgi:hypothetical protein
VRDPSAEVDPDRDSGTVQGIDSAFALTRCCAVGDQPDIDTTPLRPDQCVDGARIRGEAVRVYKDLLLGPVDRIYGQGGTVLLGLKAHRHCRSGLRRRDGHGECERTKCEREG